MMEKAGFTEITVKRQKESSDMVGPEDEERFLAQAPDISAEELRKDWQGRRERPAYGAKSPVNPTASPRTPTWKAPGPLSSGWRPLRKWELPV